MTLSHNEHRLLSCGLDGSVFCQIMPSAPEDLEPSSPPPSASDAASGDLQEVDVVDETGELSITDAAARGVMGDEGPGDAGSAQGAELRQGLSRIRDSLAALKSANAGASAAEQLETNEFVVDTEMVELSAKATQETVNSLQADIRREILHTEALTHRIREPCWEGMESKGLSLFSFEEGGPVVHEFHTVMDPKAAHALRRVKFLRRSSSLRTNSGHLSTHSGAGALPEWSRMNGSAPRSTIASAHAKKRSWTARSSGVSPLLLGSLMSASLDWTMVLMTPMCPYTDATAMGVRPAPFLRWGLES